jgi:hypothetical protein
MPSTHAKGPVGDPDEGAIMNTMGKLLVIVNLLFAVATGAFLAVDFATRMQWKRAYEEREQELVAIKENTQQEPESRRNLMAELKKLREDLNQQMIESNGREGRLNLTLKQKLDDIESLKKNVEVANLNQQKAVEEAGRLGKEIEVLTESLKKRQDEIAELQKEAAKHINLAIEADSNAKKYNQRAQAMLEQLKAANIRIQQLETKIAAGDKIVSLSPQVRDRNYINPPRVDVKGTISKVQPDDPTLVQITLGSDAGLEQDNTLEVFRLSPQPEYLGRLRLLDVRHDMAIGRVIPLPGMNAGTPRAGDQVATKLR